MLETEGIWNLNKEQKTMDWNKVVTALRANADHFRQQAVLLKNPKNQHEFGCRSADMLTVSLILGVLSNALEEGQK